MANFIMDAQSNIKIVELNRVNTEKGPIEKQGELKFSIINITVVEE